MFSQNLSAILIFIAKNATTTTIMRVFCCYERKGTLATTRLSSATTTADENVSQGSASVDIYIHIYCTTTTTIYIFLRRCRGIVDRFSEINICKCKDVSRQTHSLRAARQIL